MACSELYKHTNWVNNNITQIFNSEIIEYDLKTGGYNVCREFKLVSDGFIESLSMMPNKQKQIALGNFQRRTKGFSKFLNDGFMKARQRFFEANNIQDHEVIAVRKDAIFVDRRCSNRVFGYLRFAEKNVYSSMIKFKPVGQPMVEMYFGKDTVDIKGIADEKVALHEDYMIAFLKEVITQIERNEDVKNIVRFVKEFAHEYKTDELPIGFYRELNKLSKFKSSDRLGLDQIYYDDMDDYSRIDKFENYNVYITGIIQVLLQM